jgi:hypothetical protein
VSGAEIVALVSVVVTGVVAPYIAQRWGLTRLRWETRRDRENALVEIVEQAALALVEAQAAIQEDARRVSQLAGTDEGEQLVGAQTARLKTIWRLENRIAVRLTTNSEECRAFNDAASALAGAGTVLNEVAYGQPFDTERHRAFTAKYQESYNALGRFQDATAKRIGPGEATGLRALAARGHGFAQRKDPS